LLLLLLLAQVYFHLLQKQILESKLLLRYLRLLEPVVQYHLLQNQNLQPPEQVRWLVLERHHQTKSWRLEQEFQFHYHYQFHQNRMWVSHLLLHLEQRRQEEQLLQQVLSKLRQTQSLLRRAPRMSEPLPHHQS
jgi:hypothetical protein